MAVAHSTEISPSIARLLHVHGIRVVMHPVGSTATAKMAAARLGVALGQIANTLLWMKRATSVPLILIIGGDKRVSAQALADIAESPVRMATRQEIAQCLNTQPGALSPFIEQPIPIFIERSLRQYRYIYPAAGTDCSSVEISYQKLIEICHAHEGDFAEA